MFFFFFKQKTAYEMRISDWSSDVCSSDLPDAKSQVTLAFENGRPVRATALVVSTQHSAALSNAEGQKKLRDYAKGVMTDVLPQGWMPSDENIYVNPTGLFEIGGPDGDAGLTGRKIIVDTYGGAAPHGGGAFSGKDPTKVDRSAEIGRAHV